MGPLSKKFFLLLSLTLLFCTTGASQILAKQRQQQYSSPVTKHWVVRFLKNSFFNGKPFQFASPITEGNFLFGGANKNIFYGVDIQKGKKLWSYETLGPVQAAPALWQDWIYFGDAKGNIYALTKKEGKRFWTASVDGAVMSAPLVHEDKLYFVTMSKQVTAMDPQTGKIFWQTPPLNRDADFTTMGSADPVFAFGKLWIGYADGTLIAYEIKSGEIHRVLQLGDRNEKLHDIDATSLVDGNLFYVTSADGSLFAMNPLQDKIVWTMPIGGVNDPAIKEGKLYIAGSNTVSCLEASTGQTLWEQNLGVSGLSTPVVTDRWVIVVATKGKLFFMDRKNGDIVYARHLRGGGSYADPVLGDKDVFVLSNSGRLYGFRFKNMK